MTGSCTYKNEPTKFYISAVISIMIDTVKKFAVVNMTTNTALDSKREYVSRTCSVANNLLTSV